MRKTKRLPSEKPIRFCPNYSRTGELLPPMFFKDQIWAPVLSTIHQVVGQDSGGREGGGAKGRFHQLRKTSSKRFATIKSQISGMVNKGGSRGERRQGAPGEGGVSTAPGGEEGAQAGCGPLQSLGGRLRSSRSLQNLEQATKDSMRAMVDKTSYTASSMKHRYISITGL